MSTIEVGLCIVVAIVAGVLICYFALLRWQAGILRRERGERPQGFPVQPPRQR